MDEIITPMRFKSKRQVKRSAKMGKTVYDSLYNLKINKRKGTPICEGVTFHPAR